MVFRGFDWSQVVDSVLTVSDVALGTRTAGDCMLAALEEAVLVRKAACKQVTIAALHRLHHCHAVVPQ